MDSIPSLLGLALRAGRLAVGEEPVGAACRGHKAYLLLLASDAADNTIRRASHFSQSAKNTICLQLPRPRRSWAAGWGGPPAPWRPSPTWGLPRRWPSAWPKATRRPTAPPGRRCPKRRPRRRNAGTRSIPPTRTRGSGNNSYRSQPYRLTGAERKEQTSGLAGLSRPGRDGGGFI